MLGVCFYRDLVSAWVLGFSSIGLFAFHLVHDITIGIRDAKSIYDQGTNGGERSKKKKKRNMRNTVPGLLISRLSQPRLVGSAKSSR